MKTERTLILIAICMISLTAVSQEKKDRKRGTRKVEVVEKTIQKTNKDIDSTAKGVNSAIEGGKETVKKVKELGKILFGSKDGKKKIKNEIIITIPQVSYEEVVVDKLYTALSKIKGVKNITSNYSNGNTTISFISKEKESVVWKKCPKEIQNAFQVKKIGGNNIVLNVNNK